MRRIVLVAIIFFACFVIPPLTVSAESAAQKLTVGTRHSPPFAIRGEDGVWSGISVDLWQNVAASLNLQYDLVEMGLDELVRRVKDGGIDVAVAALTITPEREIDFDFTYPFYVDGLGIAVPAKANRSGLGALGNLFTLDFFKAVGALALVLLAVGILTWLFERRQNSEQFGGSALEGIGSGFWWSAVTMTTVGYGDKAPRTFGGRLIGLLWMFAAIIMISSFTAAIASSLTVNRLHSEIQSPEDLARIAVGTQPGSTSARYLEKNAVDYEVFESVDSALRALKQGAIEAVVYDAPILNYTIKKNFKGSLSLLPFTVEEQQYGFAVKAGSPLREAVNRSMLTIMQEPEWEEILARYLSKNA